MKVELRINGTVGPEGRYLGWSPAPCQLRVTDAEGAVGAQDVIIRNVVTPPGGKVVFYDHTRTNPADIYNAALPTDGNAVVFWAGGAFQNPSFADRDTAIEIVDAATDQVIVSVPVMVRIRKDANTLTVDERNRFVAALATLNDRGQGPFAQFRDMHRSYADDEAHGDEGFLPWHRIYMLDLERALQQIDPSVALPYWRFDRAAPNVFHRDFLGVSTPTGSVRFRPGNPLQFWATDGVVGITRRPWFDPLTERARHPQGGPVDDEATTLSLGNVYRRFRSPMEAQPHGLAHVSFGGSLQTPSTAPRDPLFFLLHGNVDRLWAKWQWFHRRFDPNDADAYWSGSRIGHALGDDMWPWNQITNDGFRPAVAPGGNLDPSPCATAPSSKPKVRETIDYQGRFASDGRLGFDYDDVPFE